MLSLFDFAGGDAPDSKMFVSRGSLPQYIDLAQPPTKRSPWRQINELAFVSSLTMLMPDETYQMVWKKLDDELQKVKYAKVVMKLEEVLDWHFFTEYIKQGNILMLSEGCVGVDNVFSLKDGVLRLDIDKESYERAGLQGRPVDGGGRKHVKARYLVEVDLRQPSMLHGKKGFERVVWASKNVLNQSLVWLFTDISKSPSAPASAPPLDKYHPTYVVLRPTVEERKDIVIHDGLHALIEDIEDVIMPEDEDEYHELLSWIDEVILGSTNVVEVKRLGTLEAPSAATTLKVLNFQGLLSPQQVLRTIVKAM